MTPMEQSERKGLVAHARKQMADLMHVLPMGVYNTMDMLCDLLSSDARPAPMADEVKTRTMVNRLHGLSTMYEGVIRETTQDAIGHIDDLTRLNATLRERLYADLSRPQETDAALAEREACAMDLLRERNKFSPGTNFWRVFNEAVAIVRSRPSPGPATETERKDGWWVTPEWEEVTRDSWHLCLGGALAGYVRRYETGWAATKLDSGVVVTNLPTREEAQDALLASVRPKEEGV